MVINSQRVTYIIRIYLATFCPNLVKISLEEKLCESHDFFAQNFVVSLMVTKQHKYYFGFPSP